MPSDLIQSKRTSRWGTAFKRPGDAGQVLVLFVLFLLVLLGVSALAIDYANWLLIDRRIQNVADHVALAGASAFAERDPDEVFNCGSGKCDDAREQAWAAFSQELDLTLTGPQISCLASMDTPEAGWTGTVNADVNCAPAVDFGHTLWVSTPPPGNGSYVNLGGSHPRHYGIVFARMDEATRSFLGGVFGITPDDRIGWATAGTAPMAFALQIFCRDNIAPENGVCENSEGLAVDGQGGVRLVRGDIGGNQGLKVSANTGSGVIVQNGQVFLVDNLPCGPSNYNCGTYPANTGGIANADPRTDSAPNWATGQTALHIPPQEVPRYESPLDGVTVSDDECILADASNLCVPYRPLGSTEPGDWDCGTGAADDRYCGIPDTSGGPGTVVCNADPVDPDATPPMIPPGYYRSIELPANSCAILDATAENQNWDPITSTFLGGLYPYQLPGVYRFGGDSSGPKPPLKIELADNSYLIGDGVTFVFDGRSDGNFENWPDPAGNQGFVLDPDSALILNTYTLAGSSPPCTSTTEGAGINMSGDWWATDLPYSAVCAAWEVDPITLDGGNAWAYCTSGPTCSIARDSYAPVAGYRGITFFFTPEDGDWPPDDILGRFKIGGAGGDRPGLAFRGLLYAPYDDVQMTGSNGFDTVGQVLAWSAKFNGGGAYIDLDYPYDYPPGDSFLLEPTIGQ
jgi:hypothetical protein